MPKSQRLERCQECRSLLLKHGYTHVFFPSFEHQNFMEIWCAGLLYYRVVETESFWRYPYAEESEWTFCLTSSEHHIANKNKTVTESMLLDYKWWRSFWPCITVLRNVGSFLWVRYMIWRWMCSRVFRLKKIHKLGCIFTAHRDILMLSIELSFVIKCSFLQFFQFKHPLTSQ